MGTTDVLRDLRVEVVHLEMWQKINEKIIEQIPDDETEILGKMLARQEKVKRVKKTLKELKELAEIADQALKDNK